MLRQLYLSLDCVRKTGSSVRFSYAIRPLLGYYSQYDEKMCQKYIGDDVSNISREQPYLFISDNYIYFNLPTKYKVMSIFFLIR